jgi:hypothetical protein
MSADSADNLNELNHQIIGMAIGRNVPRKPRLVGGVKGHNINETSFPGSPALWAGSFTSTKSWARDFRKRFTKKLSSRNLSRETRQTRETKETRTVKVLETSVLISWWTFQTSFFGLFGLFSFFGSKPTR